MTLLKCLFIVSYCKIDLSCTKLTSQLLRSGVVPGNRNFEVAHILAYVGLRKTAQTRTSFLLSFLNLTIALARFLKTQCSMMQPSQSYWFSTAAKGGAIIASSSKGDPVCPKRDSSSRKTPE